MLHSLLKSRATCTVSAIRAVPNICANIRTYKTRLQQLYGDGIDLTQQSVEINSTEHIRRCTFYKDVDIWTLYKTIYPNVRTLGDALYEGCVNSNDGPCVGVVNSLNNPESLQWLSYSMVIERSRYIGSHLWTVANLTPMQSKVSIISLNRPEYLYVEHACYMYGFILVNLYTSYEPATIMNILHRTQTEVLVVDKLERIQSIQDDLLKNDQIKQILVMDEMIDDKNSKIRSISWIFKTMTKADVRERPSVDPDSIATLIMTSGTTGEMKEKIYDKCVLTLLITQLFLSDRLSFTSSIFF